MDRYPPDCIVLLFFCASPCGKACYGCADNADACIQYSNRRTSGGTGKIPDLTAAPGRSRGAVFEDDAGLQQFVPDAIGLGEVPGFLCNSPCLDQALDSFD